MDHMETVITAKLKLNMTLEQCAHLRAMQLAYRDALNFVSEYAYAHGKMSNKVALQNGTYHEIRTRFHLPSQMACSVPRQVGATYKGLWTKVKKNALDRTSGRTKKRYKGLDQAPKYVSPTLTYQYKKDYSFRKEQEVSILTLAGRLHIPYTGYQKHLDLIEKEAQIGTAQLWYDKPHKQFYLLVSLTLEVPDPTPQQHTGIVGVDVGVRYLAVSATTRGESAFHSGKKVVSKANHNARLRKRLQKKGTRSATRRLIAISGRERRLKADANHKVSYHIANAHPHSLIGLEDLTDIRQRTRRRTRRKKKHGKGYEPASRKQRQSNAAYSKWSFAQLQGMIAYKALLSKSMAISVDAHYTSKACPMCGHTCEANRPGKGLLFVCQHCHYTLHADLVGARNIAMRTLVVRQDWMATGQLSVAPGSLVGPDVSASEAKAARLRRYAELRWMPEASPRSQDEGI
jgi:IS605 OrfB family transposase